MGELPEWIRERLENKPLDLRQEPVAKVVWESDEPYLSRSKIQQRVQEELGRTFDKTTVIERLNELCDLDVLKSDRVSNVDIYWIYDDRSDYPIPTDVEVEPISEEMTVQEFFNDNIVQFGLGGVGLILLSSIVMWIAGFASNSGPVFGWTASQFIFSGFLLILFGWMVIAGALFLWFVHRPTKSS